MESSESSATPGVVRTLSKSGRAVCEQFVWSSDHAVGLADYTRDEVDPATIIDVYVNAESPKWDPQLVYARRVPGRSRLAQSAAAYFSGNRARDPVIMPERNLSQTAPLGDAEFWGVLERVGGEASVAGAQELVTVLATWPVTQIEAFERRLHLELKALDKAACLATASLGVGGGSDALEWWKLAAVARGREFVDALRRGEPSVLSEQEWRDAEFLFDASARAYSAASGAPVVFDHAKPKVAKETHKPLSANEQAEIAIREKYGDGTRDRAPGVRTEAAMLERGLVPSLVGSRFMVRAEGAFIECVVLQHIDVYGEDVYAHLSDAADAVARDLSGRVTTRIEHQNLYTHSPFDHLTIFEIRRSWSGSLGEYQDAYALLVPAGGVTPRTRP